MKKTGLILMTALLPTTGHADLVRFAVETHLVDELYVLIHARSFEPVPSYVRVDALEDAIGHFTHQSSIPVYVISRIRDDAPQNPEDHPDFWNWWNKEIYEALPFHTDISHVFASEPYGQPLAKGLAAQFIPYDLGRSVNPVKCTTSRSDIEANWMDFLPTTRRFLGYRATMFGQESVGKTTISKLVANELRATWLPEWARPYLEAVGDDLSEEKMLNIFSGQRALQDVAWAEVRKPCVVQDTDLYSTIGYWNIGQYGDMPGTWERSAHIRSSDTYFVLPDDVPFVPDPLRYGGDVRESTTQFWTDLADKYRLPYVVVPNGSIHEKANFIISYIKKEILQKWQPIEEFVRD